MWNINLFSLEKFERHINIFKNLMLFKLHGHVFRTLEIGI